MSDPGSASGNDPASSPSGTTGTGPAVVPGPATPAAAPRPPIRRPRRLRGVLTAIIAIVVVAGAVTGVVIARQGGSGGKYSASDAPLRVFASVTPHTEILKYVNDKLTNGKFSLKIIEETDGVDGNDVVEHGDADANYFQHVPYLNSDSKDKGYTDLVVAATVHIEPYGIYSAKYKSLDAIPDGGLVLLSNNVSNFARGLYLLQAAKLITLDHKQGDASADALAITEKDIVANPKHLTFKQVEPAQIPRSLPDAAIGLINGNVALEAGLTPAKDALLLESGLHNPYANILVVPAALRGDPRVTALAKILEGPEVAAFINSHYPGSVLPVNKAAA